MEYATISKFCDAFGVSRTTLHRLTTAGTVRTIRVGGRVLVDVNTARALFASQAAIPVPADPQRKAAA
jgi:predicted site-specific integrase-resolvase